MFSQCLKVFLIFVVFSLVTSQSMANQETSSGEIHFESINFDQNDVMPETEDSEAAGAYNGCSCAGGAQPCAVSCRWDQSAICYVQANSICYCACN